MLYNNDPSLPSLLNFQKVQLFIYTVIFSTFHSVHQNKKFYAAVYATIDIYFASPKVDGQLFHHKNMSALHT